MSKLNIVILGSTKGSSIQFVIDAISSNEIDANISLIISNRKNALILEKARDNNIDCKFISAKDLTADQYDRVLIDEIGKHNPDLILLAGFMRILMAEFLNKFSGKLLNIHPSLLPKHAGLMDLAVHHSVIDAGDTISGCTIHQVTEDVDAGDIVAQLECEVFPDDTAEILKSRVQVLENKAWIITIKNWVGK